MDNLLPVQRGQFMIVTARLVALQVISLPMATTASRDRNRRQGRNQNQPFQVYEYIIV